MKSQNYKIPNSQNLNPNSSLGLPGLGFGIYYLGFI
jgi:hypothetical protein